MISGGDLSVEDSCLRVFRMGSVGLRLPTLIQIVTKGIFDWKILHPSKKLKIHLVMIWTTVV